MNDQYCKRKNEFVSSKKCSKCWGNWKFGRVRSKNIFNCRKRNLSSCGGSAHYNFLKPVCRECKRAGGCVGLRFLFGEGTPGDIFYEDVFEKALATLPETIDKTTLSSGCYKLVSRV